MSAGTQGSLGSIYSGSWGEPVLSTGCPPCIWPLECVIRIVVGATRVHDWQVDSEQDPDLCQVPRRILSTPMSLDSNSPYASVSSCNREVLILNGSKVLN